MKAIKVEYKVKGEFVEKNKENIQKVIGDLVGLNRPDILYSSWTKEDQTFVHIFMSTDDAVNPLTELESFKIFQAQLKENVEVPPSVEELSMVGSSFKLNP